MIHLKEFQALQAAILHSSNNTNQLLHQFFDRNWDEIHRVVNLEDALPDAVVDIWWLRKLADQKALPLDDEIDDGIVIETMNRLATVQTEYLVNFKAQLPAESLVSVSTIMKALDNWYAQAQSNDSDELETHPLAQLWIENRESFAVMMDNDRSFNRIDRRFKILHFLSNTKFSFTQAIEIFRQLRQFCLQYAFKTTLLSDRMFDQCIEAVKQDPHNLMPVAKLIEINENKLNAVINPRFGATSKQIANLMIISKIAKGQTPINGDIAVDQLIKRLGTLKNTYIRCIIQRNSLQSTLTSSDFKAAFSFWDEPEYMGMETDPTPMAEFWQKHQDQVAELIGDYSIYKRINMVMETIIKQQLTRLSDEDTVALYHAFQLIMDMCLAKEAAITNL
ncbi:hypothetical protein MOO44_08375 [Nicoliella spurrieriana]|uniref:Uncharacterized protein n=1 Tax=Nicoliella spurrieriana TaxID=2925830 RepID=A0A976X5P2_9LACO|nr:hypothetical protein [Nicoliella spurrieriana]UQS86864.1 hypothetical protein MOO44_08375 [Nicoliella spurrieriana]